MRTYAYTHIKDYAYRMAKKSESESDDIEITPEIRDYLTSITKPESKDEMDYAEWLFKLTYKHAKNPIAHQQWLNELLKPQRG